MDDLHVLVVALDGVHHDLVLAVLARRLAAELGVRALALEVDGLADVVEEARAPREGRVEAELGGHGAAELRDLLGVVEHVLPIGGPVAELAHELEDLGVRRVEPQVLEGLLAGGLDVALDLLGGLRHDLLDLPRVDLARLDEAVEGLAGDLAGDGVEPGDDDRVRVVVVDEELHARELLKVADVTPLVADEAPLDALVLELDDGGRPLHDLVGGDALDGERDDLLRLHLGGALGVLLDLSDEVCGLVLGLALEVDDELLLRLLDGEPRHLFKALVVLLVERGELLAPGLEGVRVGPDAVRLLLQALLAGLELALHALELGVSAVHGALDVLHGLEALLVLLLHLLALGGPLLAGLGELELPQVLRLRPGVREKALGLLAGLGRALGPEAVAEEPADEDAHSEPSDEGDDDPVASHGCSPPWVWRQTKAYASSPALRSAAAMARSRAAKTGLRRPSAGPRSRV